MQDQGGLTQLIEEILEYPLFKTKERTLNFKPDDKRTYQLIKNNLENLGIFIRRSTANQDRNERLNINKLFREGCLSKKE